MQRKKIFWLALLGFVTAPIVSPAGAGIQSLATAQTGSSARQPAPRTSPKTRTARNKKTPPEKLVPPPLIIARSEWKAKDPVGEAKEHRVVRITIHHTAVRQRPDLPVEKKMQDLQHFSQNEGLLASGRQKLAWFDVPYHFYIALDGRIAEGRDIRFAGDTNTEYDPTGHALIVLEGNFETEEPSAEQRKALGAMLAWLAARFNVASAEIKTHNDYALTACPGANLKKLLPELRRQVDEVLKPALKRQK